MHDQTHQKLQRRRLRRLSRFPGLQIQISGFSQGGLLTPMQQMLIFAGRGQEDFQDPLAFPDFLHASRMAGFSGTGACMQLLRISQCHSQKKEQSNERTSCCGGCCCYCGCALSPGSGRGGCGCGRPLLVCRYHQTLLCKQTDASTEQVGQQA